VSEVLPRVKSKVSAEVPADLALNVIEANLPLPVYVEPPAVTCENWIVPLEAFTVLVRVLASNVPGMI